MATAPSSSCVARELTDFGRAVGRYDGEGAIATCRGRVAVRCDRMRGSLRSGDMSPRYQRVETTAPPRGNDKINKSLNAIVNRKSQIANRKFPLP